MAQHLWLSVLGTLALLLVAGCGKDGSSHSQGGSGGPTTGGIVAHAFWPSSAAAQSRGARLPDTAPIPPSIVNVRLTVQGADFTAISKTFAAAAHSGVVQDVPVGSNRTLLIEALDGANQVMYSGQAAGLAVQAGQTTDAGNVPMALVIHPPPGSLKVTNPAMATPFHSNSVLSVLSGTCISSPTQSVTLSINGTPDSSQNCSGPGTFSFDLTGWSFPPNAVYDFTLNQVDVYTSAATGSATWQWEFDTIPPALTLDAPAGALTNTSAVAITGLCEAGLPISVTGTDSSSGSPVCSSGTFSQTVSSGTDGLITYTVVQADLAGNTTSLLYPWTRDTFAAPVTILLPAGGTATAYGSSLGISGGCETGATVNLSGNATGSAACAGGAFSFTVNASLDGTYTYTLQQTDLAGNISTGTTVTWNRDTTVAPVTITTPAGATAHTNLDNQTIAGTCETGAAVNMTGSATNAAACPAGTFSFSVGATSDATYTYTISQTDLAGNVASSVQVTWTRDTAISDVTVTQPAGATATTSGDSLLISGACEIGDAVNLSGSATNSTTCPAGTFSFTVNAASDATRTYTVKQTDLATNTSPGVTVTWTRNTATPATPVLVSPAALTFSQNALTQITVNCTSASYTVKVVEDSTTTFTQTCAGNNTVVTLAGSTAEATHNYSVTQYFTATPLIESAAVTVTWTKDNTAPAAVTVTAPSSLTVTNNASSLTISGACEANAIVTMGGSPSGTTPCSSNAYNFAPTESVDGTYVFTLTQTDQAANTSSGTTVTWTRDTAVPATPVVTIPGALTFSQNALSQITVNCTSAAYSIQVKEDGNVIVSAGSCSGTGTVVGFTGSAVEGQHTYAVTQTKIASGNVSAAASFTWTKDSVAPAAVTVATPAGGTATNNASSLSISGACESNATVNVGGDATTSTPCTSSAYSFLLTASTDNTYAFTLTQTDLAGNVSPGATVTWTRDTAVSPVTITTPAGSTARTNVASQIIAGGCEIGATVSWSGAVTGSMGCPSGTFGFTATASSDATYTFTLIQTDLAGNVATGVQVTWTLDTVAAPFTVAQPVGASASDANSSLTISGACENNGTIALTGSATNSTTCSGGTYSFLVTDTTPTSDANSYSVQLTDDLGNTSASLPVSWTRTIPALSPPTITLPAANGGTTDTTYANAGIGTLSGGCTGNYTVTMSGTSSQTTACANSQYSFAIPTPGSDGSYNYFVSQTDYSSVASASASRIWVFDTVSPAQVVLQNPTTTPQVTANTTNFLLSGTCEAGATVLISGSATASLPCTGGTFSTTINETVDGTYTFDIVQQDLAGNLSVTVTQEWVRDSTAVQMPTLDPSVAVPTETSNLADVVITGTCPVSTGASNPVVVYLQDSATPLPSIADDPGSSTTSASYPYRAVCSPSGTFSMNVNNSNAGGPASYWDTPTQALIGTAPPNGTYTWSLVVFASIDSGVTWDQSAGVYYQMIVNTTTPPAPTLTAPVSVAAGGTGSYTAPGPLTLTGSCIAGDTVTLNRASGNLSATCGGTGAFTISGADEASNNVTYPYTFTDTSLAGLTSPGTVLNWTRISGFSPPVITSPATNPFTSNQNTVALSGTCISTLTVNLEDPIGTVAQTVPCSSGSFLLVVDKSSGTQVDRVFNLAVSQTNGIDTSPGAPFQWHQDTTPPDITVSYALPIDPATASSPGSPVTSPAAQSVFEFSTSDPTATIECNLNNSAWAACTSPLVYTAAQIAATPTVNSIAIRAKDPAGNTSTTPYQRYWVRQSFGTVALYHFDTAPGPTVDSSPYNAITASSLTNVGTTTGGTSKFGQSRQLASGSSQYLWINDRVQHATRTRMTVELFVKFTSVPANGVEFIFASKWNTTSRYAWEFGVRGSGGGRGLTFFRTYTLTSTGVKVVEVVEGATHTPSTSSFRHYAATWDRGVISIYRNGRRRSQVTAGIAGTSLVPDGAGNLYLGTTENGAGTLTKFLNGLIDEVRVSQAVCYTTTTYTIPGSAFTTADCAAP